MKRFLALFLSLSISLQSFTAVGESTRLMSEGTMQEAESHQEEAGETLSSEESESTGIEEGNKAQGEESAEAEETSEEATELSEASVESENPVSEQESSSEESNVESAMSKTEGTLVSENNTEADKAEVGQDGDSQETIPVLSYSNVEKNEKKHFQYKNDEISVSAELEYPDSLPKGVMFLVRPILEEERKEQYQAYREALLEAQRKKTEENGGKALRSEKIKGKMRLMLKRIVLKKRV